MRPEAVTWCNLLNGVGRLATFQDNFFQYIISRGKKDIWMLPFSKGNLTTVRKREKYPSPREVHVSMQSGVPTQNLHNVLLPGL